MEQSPNIQPYFFIRTLNRYEKIKYAELVLVRGNRNYVQLVTETRTFMVLLSLQALRQYLPREQFCQVHRSYIVNLDRIRAFDKNTIWLQLPEGREYNRHLLTLKEIPLGDRFRKSLRDNVKVIPNRSGVDNGMLEKAKFVLESEELNV